MEKVGRVADEVKGTVARAAEEVTSTAQREARAQDLRPKDAGAPGAGGSGAPKGRPPGPRGRPPDPRVARRRPRYGGGPRGEH